MKRTSRKQKMVSEINITPFTDVILVLLVIFMVSTPLIYQSNIQVKLPESKSAKVSQSKDQEVTITITGENVVYLGKDIVTTKELRDRLKVLYKKNSQIAVILSADKRVRFKYVVDVIDMLTELGITKFDIATTNVQQ
ncbi:MAG: biopolymer transporter ExbD [Candidatus Omnitrophica bacterium]|nr:biopolymer transporter ExbD [Candidatus Omnitrophota bacterium]